MGGNMDDSRPCNACGTSLAGPFQPKIVLTQEPLAEEPQGEKVHVAAHAWICPGCGLVHWYAQDEDLNKLPMPESAEEAGPKPGTSYERRAQMLRMLRRVRRM
jgi:hypothetical protein